MVSKLVNYLAPLVCFLGICFAFYTEEPVLKLFTVLSYSTRYPASDSAYRLFIEQGYDEDAGVTPDEALNGFPSERMVLSPGGCATYIFPVEDDQTFAFVIPARKPGVNGYEDFCNKGSLAVDVASPDLSSVQFNCFTDEAPCDGFEYGDSTPCSGEISSILSPDAGTKDLTVELCNSHAESTSAVWEIDFSSSYDYGKMDLTFTDEGRTRIVGTQDTPDFNTQLSMVSVVGERHVGKSTILSLLSGNATMFQTGDSSTGTTTVGVDFSTILPAQDWINTLSSSIGIEIDSCGSNLPLFLLDSEGMGVRGDKFDSLTSGPPAILAKQIIYVGEHTLVTQEILNSVGKYLDSLSGIIGGTGDDGNPDDYSCDVPVLETFILVINKLSDNTPDEELYRVVFTPEPEIDEEAAERNDVRQKLQTCFSGTNVVGIPQEQLGDGESMDYPYLSQRFKEELATLANLIVATLEDPHIVPVEGARLFNSTNAEGIIDTLVYQANSGAISLQGNPYIESAQAEVTALLGEANSHLYNLEPNCEQLATGYSCTNCVCSYRNEFLELTLNDIDDILTQANADSLNEFSEDISSQLEQFKSDMVDPWSIANYCFPEKIFYKSKQDDQICDISTMQDVLTQPGTNVALFCNQIFFCSTSTVSLTGLAVTATTVYIEAGYRIEAVQPNQAESGPDGATYGANGGNGYPGLPGPNITVEGDILLETPRSEYVITYMTQGGKGGNGGNGHIGDPESGFAKPSATTIVTTGSLYGSQYDVAQPGCGHCHGYTCHCHEWKQDYEIVLTKSACGGNGGNAGVGGSPGNLVVTGAIADLVQISLEPSTTDGDVGLGGTGSTFEMQYIATDQFHESDDCEVLHGCEYDGHHAYVDKAQNDRSVACNGVPGIVA